VAEVTAPEHHFHCDRWSCTIAAKDCTERYKKGGAKVEGRGTSRRNAERVEANRFSRCAGCPIGADLLVRIGKKPTTPAVPAA
jgi:hypothetical protein